MLLKYFPAVSAVTIDLMVGVDNEGVVTGISVLSLSESPGLGANAKNGSRNSL